MPGWQASPPDESGPAQPLTALDNEWTWRLDAYARAGSCCSPEARRRSQTPVGRQQAFFRSRRKFSLAAHTQHLDAWPQFTNSPVQEPAFPVFVESPPTGNQRRGNLTVSPSTHPMGQLM
jgi:hypothetical protein